MLSKQLSVAIVGIFGKMGQALLQLLPSFPDLKLAYGVARSLDSSHKDEDFPVLTSLRQAHKVDIILDFSSKDTLDSTLNFATSHQIPLVLGTTGLDENMQAALKDASTFIPIIFNSNFSLSVTLIHRFLSLSQAALKDFFIDISETHHVSKKDIPSRTAISFVESLGRDKNNILFSTPSIRKSSDIIIHSSRVPYLTTKDEIKMSLGNEELTISHQCYDRKAFARGALEAALFLHSQSSGLFTMQDVLNSTLSKHQPLENAYA